VIAVRAVCEEEKGKGEGKEKKKQRGKIRKKEIENWKIFQTGNFS
jgi:hypothetical protein